MSKSSRPSLKRWLTPALFLGILAGLWGIFRRRRPQIESIPVIPPGGALQIFGRHFGNQPGKVQIYHETQAPIDLEITFWSPRFISTRIPDDIQTGRVEVSRAGKGALKQAHSFQRQARRHSSVYGYQVPVQADSPWPTFRRDHRNTGWSPIQARYHNDQPWVYKTRKGIFSTPVIDASGRIFFGSADHYFYALSPDGKLIWSYKTGEIIDSAAAITEPLHNGDDALVTFISGDGGMYRVKDHNGDLIWKFEAPLRPEVSFNRWFEGNVAIGFDGTLYAGNTNFAYYAITPDGQLKWAYNTLGNNWSQAAFGDDGTIYWGSTDTFIRAVSVKGEERWRRRTLGFIAASAAVGTDGTIYIASFDSNLYALDPRNGTVKWKFPTGDHVYSSAALGQDEDGHTKTIYFASTDGFLYALNPQGELHWKFDAGDPIRSSPVVGLSAEGQEIVYVGCGDGRLYAVNGGSGELRWVFDTTPDEPELRDRNDLNGSPALGKTSIYIGGEHGRLCYIPYDYPLAHPEDPRCQLTTMDHPADGAVIYFVTPGGTSLPTPPDKISSAPLLTFRLKAWQAGHRVEATFCRRLLSPGNSLVINCQPEIKLRVELSADGRYLHVLPQDFLKPGSQFNLQIQGRYEIPARRVGNLTLFTQAAGEVEASFSFEVERPDHTGIFLQVGSNQTQAFEWTRLAATFPTMLPSLNQIGFDYMDWIVGIVDRKPTSENGCGRLLLWAIGAQRTQNGELIPDLTSDFTLPLGGSYQNNSFIIRNRNFHMAITGIDIPFTLFELRGDFDNQLQVKPGAGAFAETKVLSIPNFGPKMIVAGLANNWYQKLVVAGTYITRPYPPDSLAAQRPQDLHVTGLDFRPATRFQRGWVRATLSIEASTASIIQHRRFGLLLADSENLEPVALDYHHLLMTENDPDSLTTTVSLILPGGTQLPKNLQIYVLVDVFPIYSRHIALG